MRGWEIPASVVGPRAQYESRLVRSDAPYSFKRAAGQKLQRPHRFDLSLTLHLKLAIGATSQQTLPQFWGVIGVTYRRSLRCLG